MAYPVNRWSSETTISYTVDLSGAPAIAAGTDESVFFAQVVKGTNPRTGATTNGAYDIIVGSINRFGILKWMIQSPKLVTPFNESEISIAVGSGNEIFVAFVTPSAVQDRFNMSTIPCFCPEICQNTGPYDIVMARIDENADKTNASVTWVIQDATINSCNNETKPKLCVDKQKQLLYITFECSKVLQCYNIIPSSPNVVLSCFNFSGVQLWASIYEINSNSQNKKPAVAAANGAVYVAFESTATVPDGRPHDSQQVDVVKFITTLSETGEFVSYAKQWTLSNTINLFAYDGTCSDPDITIDAVGNVTLAMLTTDVVLYGVHSTDFSKNDLVLISFSPDAELRWMKQGGDLNLSAYEFRDCYTPSVSSDDSGTLYVSLVTFFYDGLNQNVIVYKINTTTAEFLWGNRVDYETFFNCYTLARTGGPNAVFPSGVGTSSPFSKTTIAAYKRFVYLGLGTRIPAPAQTKVNSGFDTCLMIFSEVRYFDNYDPFGYMAEVKKICSCGTPGCAC